METDGHRLMDRQTNRPTDGKKKTVFLLTYLVRWDLNNLDKDVLAIRKKTKAALCSIQKVIISQTDLGLVILSSKTHVFEDKLTRC